VDLRRGIIRRIPNKTARRNPKPVIIPIHPVLRGMLSTLPTESRGEHVLPKTAHTYLNHRRMLVQEIQDHFKSCGLQVHKTGVANRQQPVIEVGFHSLRHTFVSLCRESNAPLAVVEAIVGHSNPSMTRHYTHIGEVAAGRAVAALPSVIEDEKPGRTMDQQTPLHQAIAIAQGMTAANWQLKRAEILALATTTLLQ
jgi:integrase